MALAQIRATFDLLSRDLGKLEQRLMRVPVHLARVASLPPIKPGDEHLPVETIVPRHHTGREAMVTACSAFRDLHIKDGCSKKSARRYPGYCQIRPSQVDDPGQLLALVDCINQAKREIKHLVTDNFESRTARFDALHSQCPGVMTVHLYREISLFAEGDVDSIRCTWLNKDALNTLKPKNAIQWQRSLASLLDAVLAEGRMGDADKTVAMHALASRIESVPPASLRFRRQVKVQPAANVKRSGATKPITAALPILIVQEARIEHKPLPSYAPKERVERSDKTNNTRIGSLHGWTIEQRLA
ncbi:DNA replication terminus site-binding protein [Aliagarivorans taiwanensis]|uniref:DNA replication terminus site-binding protein n=1 Tax=Aliagarivorans taiwanensis TaxID=561966 RepID=UPI00047C4564|nr:DNA replication terminus site-binding protein [Aliagarivorans taiwanensis]